MTIGLRRDDPEIHFSEIAEREEPE